MSIKQNDCIREEGFHVMSRDKEIFQCSCCGHINRVDVKYKPQENEIYVPMWCERCRDQTTQLYCGDNINDLYELYDVNIDPKFYKY